MLDHLVITRSYFGDPDPAPRRARCGTSATHFSDIHRIMLWSAATPGLALWFTWAEYNFAEAGRRIRELN